MDANFQRQQAAAGLERLAGLVRAQSWHGDGMPSLPPTQAAVLRMLTGNDAGLRAGQISQRLGISAASLSDSLKTMQARTWVCRTPDPDDARAALVRLTASGRRLAEQLCSPEHGMARLLEGLDDGDLGALLRVTQLLVRQAQRQGLATGARTCLDCRFFRPYASGEADRPHVCAFLGQPFGDAELRVECAEQQSAEVDDLAASEVRFRTRIPP